MKNFKVTLLKLSPANRILINLKLLQGFPEVGFVKCLEISSNNARVLIKGATENLRQVSETD